MIYTNHAEERVQQRAIPEMALELLERYGCIEYSDGACIRYFDRHGFKKVEKLVKRLSGELEKLSGLYFVEASEGVVVTVGHRTRKIKHAYKPHAKRRKRIASFTFAEPRRGRHHIVTHKSGYRGRSRGYGPQLAPLPGMSTTSDQPLATF